MSIVEIPIRSIQHYMYCPHRWGLMEIGKVWAENVFVTRANLIHSRVHDPDKHHVSRGKEIYTSVQVYNDQKEYNLFGVLDCLELTKNSDGVSIDGSKEKYHLCIVEYKPTKPRDKEYHEEDLIQVFAQKICVDHVFGSDCDAVLYYADVKKRFALPLKENFAKYDQMLKGLLAEMRNNFENGVIPPIKKGQKCNGCSLKDICMPAMKKPKSVLEEIREIQKADMGHL